MGIVLLQQAILLFTMDGTGDDGDSVEHYLHNKYAFEYPHLFLHSWAKPIFVLTSCLFAQLGFIGIKLFNSIMALSAAYLSYKLAKKISLPYAELTIPLLMFMPHYLHLSLSGLTEPLFSLMAIGSIYLIAIEKNGWAALLISFMPFSRPEGLYFIAIAGLYFLLYKQYWKLIPILLFGHVLYTILGVVFFEESWLWIFTKNPNAMIDPAYNKIGNWFHYINGLRGILGIPIYVIFWMGCIAMSIPIGRQIKKIRAHLIPVLILAATFSVIISHTIFWRFGLFKSFGLTRNLLTIAPFMSIIALAGMQGLWDILNIKDKLRNALSLLVIGIALIYLYSSSPFTVKFPRDFQLNSRQKTALQIAEFIEDEYPQTQMTYHFYPYLNMVQHQDPFDWKHHKKLFQNIFDAPLPNNAIIIWDDWYARLEGKVTLDMLHKNEQLDFLKTFTSAQHNKKERTFVLFKTKKWD